MRRRAHLLIGFAAVFGVAARAAGGTITAVSASPATIVAGGSVSVLVSGSNPCGAAHIIYGDGTAITYPIYGLPVTQAHVYDQPGKYTITARGMGNCDGEATTTLTVTPKEAPPQPAAPPAAISDVQMAPSPARANEPVTVNVRGSGSCVYDVSYGDGASEQVNKPFPHDTRHTYAKPGTYTVIVKPQPPCVGRFTQLLQVTEAAPRPAQAAHITRVLVVPSRPRTGQPVSITVEGSGTCRFTIDYGDGTWDSRSVALPNALQHVYDRGGSYTVLALADAPCTGSGRNTFRVARVR